MPYRKILMVIAIGALVLSACQMPYPGADADPIPTNPFVKPLATDQMSNLQLYATGTAAEKTAIAEGKPTSTLTPLGGELTPSITPGTPAVGITATNTPLGGLVIPTNTPAAHRHHAHLHPDPCDRAPGAVHPAVGGIPLLHCAPLQRQSG